MTEYLRRFTLHFNHQILTKMHDLKKYIRKYLTIHLRYSKKENHIHCMIIISSFFFLLIKVTHINHDFVQIKINSSTTAPAITVYGQRVEDIYVFSSVFGEIEFWLSVGCELKTPETLVFPRGTPLGQSDRSRRWPGRSASSTPALWTKEKKVNRTRLHLHFFKTTTLKTRFFFQ